MDFKINSDFYPDFETMLMASNESQSFGETYMTIEIWNDDHWNIIHLNVNEIIQFRDFLNTIVGTKKG